MLTRGRGVERSLKRLKYARQEFFLMGLTGQLGNYRLIQMLGQGGFAEVYLGEHVYLGTQAAIKVLQANITPSEEASFRQEAKIIARLAHPHIVHVLDFDVQAGTPFLVMDYAPGGTMRRRYPRGTCVALPDVVSSVKQIAEALQYAHDQKVIHRDLKPENLLIGARQEILLSDFGIALLSQTSRPQSTQQVVGTTAYMAPEQLRGHPSFASDQYALAVIIYEWLCGERPFQGTFAEVASCHLYKTPPSLCQKNQAIPPGVEEVVFKALEKDPHARFGRVLPFVEALERAMRIFTASTISVVPGAVGKEAQMQVVAPTVRAGTMRTQPAQPLRQTQVASVLPTRNVNGRRRIRTTKAIKTICGILLGLSVLLWLVSNVIMVSLHTTFALVIILCLMLWVAAYADHRRAVEGPHRKPR
jgi:serine/threonine protein kinase